MHKRILFVLIIISSLIIGGCSNSGSETQIFAPSATTTPDSEKVPALDAFDSSYTNLLSYKDSIAYANGRIYFTSGSMLYCLDISTNQKTVIADDIIVCNIYLIENYVYFLREQTFNRVDAETNMVEELSTATEMVELSFDMKNHNPNRTVNYTLRLVEGTQEFEGFQVLGDGDILILYYGSIVQEGDWGTDSAYIYPDSTVFTPLKNSNNTNIISPDGVTPLFEYDYNEAESGEGKQEQYNLSYISMPNEEKKIATVFYNITDYNNPNEDFWGHSASNEDGMLVLNGSDGIMVLSGNKAFSEYIVEDTCVINEHNLETYEKTVLKELEGSDARLIAFDQYVLCYYYDRKASDGIQGPSGVILFDTKNDITYENEEINQVISGDINYKNLMNIDFYLDGDKLYMLENESIEIAMDDLTDEQKAALSEKEIISQPFQDFIDPVSKSNLYKAEIVDGKLHFTLLYKEF